MSKSKKQVTNRNRQRRLGTGQGITTPPKRRGTPVWAWLVAALIITGGAVVSIAIVTTRGSTTPGGGGDSASIVQNRLSHQRLDFISQPTWQPNYTNLRDAIDALGLPGLSDTVLHYHYHLTLIVDGHRVPIPAQIGLDAATQTGSPIHTHDERGVIHVEADNQSFRGTLGQLFDIWGVAFTSRCLGGYCQPIRVWVNGRSTTKRSDLTLSSHDAVTIVVGNAPAGFHPDTSFRFAARE